MPHIDLNEQFTAHAFGEGLKISAAGIDNFYPGFSDASSAAPMRANDTEYTRTIMVRARIRILIRKGQDLARQKIAMTSNSLNGSAENPGLKSGTKIPTRALQRIAH